MKGSSIDKTILQVVYRLFITKECPRVTVAKVIFGGVMVIVLDIGSKVHRFKAGQKQ
jgi:hypothetical protein